MSSPQSTRSQKQLDKCARLLQDCGLLETCSSSSSTSLPEIVRCLITSTDDAHQGFSAAQVQAWSRCLSDLTLDASLAVEALRLGVLPALPHFLRRYKSSTESAAAAATAAPPATAAAGADVSWGDALIALHNFALLEDRGFPEALAKLEPADLDSIATNLASALKPSAHPTEARDATSRLAVYPPMMGPLIDRGVLVSLIAFIPSVKPLNRLPPSQWGPDSVREINNTLNAMDLLLYAYSKTEREQDLPTRELAGTHLTGWICDVLHGASATDPKLREDIEQQRVSALECLTSLLIHAAVCRLAVPGNRSMLFRVASAINGSSSVALLSAAAQVLAQALSEGDLVSPTELASLHTYDLVRHLSQVLDSSREFRDLLNVVAALQNILDPAHFKGNIGPMKKVAERLVACEFEQQMARFMQEPKSRFDMPAVGVEPAYPSPDDYEALVEAGKGALENTRALLQAVGPVTVPLMPPPVPALVVKPPAPAAQRPAVTADSGKKGRKGVQHVAVEVVAAGKPGAKGAAPPAGKGKRKQAAAPAAEQGAKRGKADKAANGKPGRSGAAPFFPPAERARLEKEMRRAALLAAPLLSGSPLKSIVEWFHEWAGSRERLEDELGTDVHMDDGDHRLLLHEAIEQGNGQVCLELLASILQVRLPLPGAEAAAKGVRQQVALLTEAPAGARREAAAAGAASAAQGVPEEAAGAGPSQAQAHAPSEGQQEQGAAGQEAAEQLVLVAGEPKQEEGAGQPEQGSNAKEDAMDTGKD